MDKKHFPNFYREHVKRVYRFLLYRIGGKKEMAEDLTQDVFLKAFNAFDRYDPAISATSWILTIARNHLINQLQKERPGVDLEEIENTLWDRDDVQDRLATNFDERRLIEAIGKLDKESADLVQKKYLEGWSYEDIAAEMGKNAGALRVQAHRVLKELKKLLKQK
jgi:RNA polymerase sigma-70 factor (ECF subfamily)